MNLKTYLQSHSQVELSRKLGVTSGAVSHWANGTNAVAAERCPQIELATAGLVRCEDLRPDVRWDVLREPMPPTPAQSAQASTDSVAQVA